MAKPLPLPIYDRKSGKLIEEWMEDSKATYESHPQWSPTQWIKSHPLYDWTFAGLQHSHHSTKKIQPFIQKHHINMQEFEPVIYRSYADFFVRRFRPGMRYFPAEQNQMGAFAEARYMAWNKLEPDQKLPVKGYSLDAAKILGSAERAKPFLGGPVFMVRLAPVGYHHVHYPDDGYTVEHFRLGHCLWTVNWRALLNKQDILFRNERQIHILETKNIGRIALVEIGAMTVGKIVQVHSLEIPFQRGEEKSVFQFGGSAIVAFGEAGKWQPCRDILENTVQGIETYVRLGNLIATAV